MLRKFKTENISNFVNDLKQSFYHTIILHTKRKNKLTLIAKNKQRCNYFTFFMYERRCHSNAHSLLWDTKVRVENAQQEGRDRSSKYNFILIPATIKRKVNFKISITSLCISQHIHVTSCSKTINTYVYSNNAYIYISLTCNMHTHL